MDHDPGFYSVTIIHSSSETVTGKIVFDETITFIPIARSCGPSDQLGWDIIRRQRAEVWAEWCRKHPKPNIPDRPPPRHLSHLARRHKASLKARLKYPVGEL